jgi:dCMP deaminase
MRKVLIAYIPVIHEGYKKFIESHADCEILYLFGPELINKFDYLSKEIRALDPQLVKKALDAMNIIKEVKVLTSEELNLLNNKVTSVVIPEEDVTIELANEFLPEATVILDKVFLRWDKHNSTKEQSVDVDQTISSEEFDQLIIKNIRETADRKSSDWWRRVGAAVVKDGKVLLDGVNKHVPSAHTPYVNGDPRNAFHKGVNIDLSTALHAEAGLIAEAARQGLNLTGCAMYVSTFPCPGCAKLIAYSGISKVYYTGGYGMLDAESILKSQNVEIVFVDITSEKNKPAK